MSLLVRKLGLDPVEMRRYVLELFRNNDNFIMLVNFIADEEGSDIGLQRLDALHSVEEQALKMADFIHSIADFPFSICDDGKSHDFVHYMIKKAVRYLEGLAESYIIVDMHH